MPDTNNQISNLGSSTGRASVSNTGTYVRVANVKKCNVCGEDKPLEQFHRRGDGYQHACKPCKAKIAKGYYARNKDHHQSVASDRRSQLRDWANELKQRPCVDCNGVFHFRAMQWDHVGTDKVANVSVMVTDGFGRETILSEIAKCELVCANCHAVRTYEREKKNTECG